MDPKQAIFLAFGIHFFIGHSARIKPGHVSRKAAANQYLS
jgi:hypothetical protein